MPTTRNDGSVVYYPGKDQIAQVTLDGRDVTANNILEVMVRRDGYGYVVMLKDLDGTEKKWVDNQWKTYTHWGMIGITI